MVYLGIYATLNPSVMPTEKEKVTARDLWMGLIKLLPVMLLIIFVVGTMLLGYATPNEAAAVGVLGALVVSLLQG